MPANEAFQMIEATKGTNSYYLTSDGSSHELPHSIRDAPASRTCNDPPGDQRQHDLRDLIAYLGSIDFVMAGRECRT